MHSCGFGFSYNSKVSVWVFECQKCQWNILEGWFDAFKESHYSVFCCFGFFLYFLINRRCHTKNQWPDMIKAMQDTSQKGRLHLNMLLNHSKITHRVLPPPQNTDSLTPLISATTFIKRNWSTWACKWFYSSPEIMVTNDFWSTHSSYHGKE